MPNKLTFKAGSLTVSPHDCGVRVAGSVAFGNEGSGPIEVIHIEEQSMISVRGAEVGGAGSDHWSSFTLEPGAERALDIDFAAAGPLLATTHMIEIRTTVVVETQGEAGQLEDERHELRASAGVAAEGRTVDLVAV